jgi:ribosomal protein S18 acetylase RimI-like enzyme
VDEASPYIQVREATPNDASRIVRLVESYLRDEGEDPALTTEGVHSYLREPATTILLAEVEGEVAGLVSFQAVLDLYHGGLSGLVQELAVDEAHRRLGVGGTLLDTAVERLRRAGCVEVTISTEADNDAALSLYRGRGFTDVAVCLERHFEQGERP